MFRVRRTFWAETQNHSIGFSFSYRTNRNSFDPFSYIQARSAPVTLGEKILLAILITPLIIVSVVAAVYVCVIMPACIFLVLPLVGIAGFYLWDLRQVSKEANNHTKNKNNITSSF